MSSSTGKKLAASFAILAAVGAFVSFGVFSAFSDTRSNTSNLKSAKFALTQAPGVSSLLDTITGLIPGDLISRCVKLTNDGDVPVTVVADPSMSGTTLASVETMALRSVTGITSTDPTVIKSCTGAVDGSYLFGSGGGVAGTGLAALGNITLTGAGTAGAWDPGESHFYKVILSLPSTVTDPTLADKASDAGLDFIATQVGTGSNK